jgi:hypothetical protein
VTPPSRARRGARRKPLNTFAPPEHDPLSDSRLRPLVERYASLSGATLHEFGPHLVELRVPETDRSFFDGRERVLVAFAVAALDHSPESEMAVIGSPFVEQLLAAIRARGARLFLGMATTSTSADDAMPPLAIPLKNGTAGTPTVRVARHPVGRLLARVLIRAGASVEEHLTEGSFFDLATGAPLPKDVAESCVAAERATPAPKTKSPKTEPTAALAPARPISDLVELMVADLRARLSPRVDQLRAEAEHALGSEVTRIDRYYRSLLEDIRTREGDAITIADAGRAVEAEHARRRLEEERRHQVRAVVHPLQIVEMKMIVQRATWAISTANGRRAELAAQRYLNGPGAWSVNCPTCAREPSALLICRGGELACDSCASECSVCGEGFRPGQGPAACHVDGASVCLDDARTCSSCERQHCTAHEGQCAEGSHAACASCLALCAHCGRTVCASHAVTSVDDAPMGSRRLCALCVVHCEGRRSEPVGRDEAIACATCDRFVCEKHQATCDLDGKVHCSTHLARTDQSGRLVCEADRSTCAHEPDSIFAADEVSACPVCARSACGAHMQECTNCGRRVCVGDWEQATSRCATCRQLVPYPTPSAAEVAAAAEANEGRAPEPKKWRAARDATHLIAEMSQGWRRRVVISLRHGESRAEIVMSHTARGSQRKPQVDAGKGDSSRR